MPSESDIVERLSNDPIDRGDGHKAQYFLRAHANNCRLETAYLTAERMDECADILAAQATTIEAMRAENERLRGVLDNAASIAENGTEQAYAPDVRPTRRAFHDAVRAKLKQPQLRLFDPVLAIYPSAMSTEDLADQAGYSAGSGNFNNLRGSLRTIGLIDYPAPGQVRAAEWLFP